MNSVIARVVLVLLAALACGATRASARHEGCSANVLIEWNAQLLRIGAGEDGLLTLKTVRTAAMMHIAVHDAINSIHRHYERYAFEGEPVATDPVAAATQAAYTVVVSQYPRHEAELRERLMQGLSAVRNGEIRQRAIALGEGAAAAILEKRAADGWDASPPYQFRDPQPGVYADFPEHSGTPPGFVFGTGWARARPFALVSPSQFRVPPPPAVSSATYAVAFNEVKTLGKFDGDVRTLAQTHVALWWKDFAENSHNRLARQLTAEHGTDLWTAARMFALLNIAIFDGYVSSFDSKFAYNHWRPYTAIHAADRDGNANTHADPQWTNTHRHTYPFPSYPSAHGTVCAAGMIVLADTFGALTPFTMTTLEVREAGPLSPLIRLDPSTRTFRSFAAAARECADSRVLLGIHFSYDALAGNRLGREVGRYTIDRYLTREE